MEGGCFAEHQDERDGQGRQGKPGDVITRFERYYDMAQTGLDCMTSLSVTGNARKKQMLATGDDDG